MNYAGCVSKIRRQYKWSPLNTHLLVIARDLLRQRGQVVEVGLRIANIEASGPVRVDVGHVHPRNIGTGKCVVDDLLRQPNLRDAQDVVDIADNGQALWGYQIRRGISRLSTVCMDVQPLDFVRLVSGSQAE